MISLAGVDDGDERPGDLLVGEPVGLEQAAVGRLGEAPSSCGRCAAPCHHPPRRSEVAAVARRMSGCA